MDTAVLISTYNQPQSLRRCLLGLLAQTRRDFQTVVADDGSTETTAAVLREPCFEPLRIQHVWQRDQAWRRPRVLNLVLAQLDAEYCIFIDGDCIPRADFVAQHLHYRQPGYYVSGTRVHVPDFIHEQFTDKDVLQNHIFDVHYLMWLNAGLVCHRRRLHPGRWEKVWNWLTYRPRCWYGSNAAAWRRDILKVNGFDETFGYGSDDREFGSRLSNAGIRSRFRKFSLCQMHQGHPTNPDTEGQARNRRRFRNLFFSRKVWCDLGIDTVLAREAAEREEFARQFDSVGRLQLCAR